MLMPRTFFHAAFRPPAGIPHPAAALTPNARMTLAAELAAEAAGAPGPAMPLTEATLAPAGALARAASGQLLWKASGHPADGRAAPAPSLLSNLLRTDGTASAPVPTKGTPAARAGGGRESLEFSLLFAGDDCADAAAEAGAAQRPADDGADLSDALNLLKRLCRPASAFEATLLARTREIVGELSTAHDAARYRSYLAGAATGELQTPRRPSGAAAASDTLRTPLADGSRLIAAARRDSGCSPTGSPPRDAAGACCSSSSSAVLPRSDELVRDVGDVLMLTDGYSISVRQSEPAAVAAGPGAGAAPGGAGAGGPPAMYLRHVWLECLPDRPQGHAAAAPTTTSLLPGLLSGRSRMGSPADGIIANAPAHPMAVPLAGPPLCAAAVGAAATAGAVGGAPGALGGVALGESAVAGAAFARTGGPRTFGGASAVHRPRILVELRLREQFEISRPSAAYARLLEALPHEFVGSTERLTAVVDVMVEQMNKSFRERGMSLPPWRQAPALVSKWRQPAVVPHHLRMGRHAGPVEAAQPRPAAAGAAAAAGRDGGAAAHRGPRPCEEGPADQPLDLGCTSRPQSGSSAAAGLKLPKGSLQMALASGGWPPGGPSAGGAAHVSGALRRVPSHGQLAMPPVAPVRAF